MTVIKHATILNNSKLESEAIRPYNHSMICVHHLNKSRSHRILWLLEELQIPYEIQRYERDPKTMLAPKSLIDVHPLGKSPIVTDGKVTVAESGAIIDYILETYGNGRLAPTTSKSDRMRFTYWMHYAEGSLMPPLLLTLIFSRLPKQPMPFFAKPVVKGISSAVLFSYVYPQVNMHLDFVEGELNKSEWFAGNEFSAADIQMSFPIEAAEARGLLKERHLKLKKYVESIRERPAYKKAIEVGGPYDLLS